MMIKPGVRIFGIRPEIVVALSVADGVYREAVQREMVVTSVIDGQHMDGSLHYAGAAADLRTHDLTEAQAWGITELLKLRLGGDFDVILEADHIHIEFQPKRGYA